VLAAAPEISLFALGRKEATAGTIFLAAALGAPTADDLADTEEAPLTPEIQALAASFENDPLKLYEYVRNSFRTELYFGSNKGARGVLAEGGGNDFDQASLLVALLRASGIPARYEHATVELSAQQVLGMSGFSTVEAAAEALAYVGYPTEILYPPSGQGASSAEGSPLGVRTERVFVRARVPYGNYRGTGPSSGRQVWVRLDPALKSHDPGRRSSLRGLASFDENAYLATVKAESPREFWEAGLLAAAKARNVCDTLNAGLWSLRPIPEPQELLPEEHPGKLVSSLLVFSRVPDPLAWKLGLELPGGTASQRVAKGYGLPMSVTFPGTSAADRAAIGDDITQVTPYRVNVTPTISLGDLPLVSGDAQMPGSLVPVTVRLQAPRMGPVLAHHQIAAGGIFALGVSTGVTPLSRVQEADLARATLPSSASRRERELGIGQATLLRYLAGIEGGATRIFGLEGHAMVHDMTEVIAGQMVVAQYRFGLPVSLAWGSRVMDAARESTTPLSVDGAGAGPSDRLKALNLLAGFEGSFWEAKAFEEVMHVPAVSTVRTVAAAYAQGIEVLRIDASNAAIQLPRIIGYSDLALEEITNAVGAGMVAILAQRPVDYEQYSAKESWILLDPETGTGLYRGTGGLNEAECAGEDGILGTPDDAKGCPCACGLINSTTDYPTGSWWDDWSDLSVPAVGIPIFFGRVYRSTATQTGALGSKWQHSYETHLKFAADGSPTWVNQKLQELTFVAVGAKAWRGPPGWHETIAGTTSGYELRFEDGLIHGFGLDGRLLFQRDPNGNQVDLHYAPGPGGKLLRVSDATGRVALSFAYDPMTGFLASVTDLAGRVVSYSHQGTDLVGVVDVGGGTEGYSYSSDHLLLTKTDQEGFTWTELYDAEGRWTGFVDPAGGRGQVLYDMGAKKAIYIDRTGSTKSYEWNEVGNPLAVTDALGERRVRTFDAEQNLLTDRDGRGSESLYQYDSQGRRTRQTDPEGRSTTWTYEPTFGHLKQTTYPDNRRVTNSYDARGNLLTSSDEKNQLTSYAYTAAGQLESITQPGGASTTLTYDPSGSVATMTDPEGGTTTLGYDAAGHLTTMTDPSGTSRTMVVDAKGQVQSMVDGLGNITSFSYDARGNRLSSTDARGATSSFSYDAQGRLTSTTDAQGGTTHI